MQLDRRLLLSAVAVCLIPTAVFAKPPALEITTPVSPPAWALLERELIRANTEACEEFFARYFDNNGYLLCVERWGGDDGPDDAIENCNDWPILHALGAPDSVLQMYKHAWEGHLRQFTLAKTTDVPFARDGMYYKEFPVMFDWVHNAEGLRVFNLQGLSDPADGQFEKRVRRFAGFYMNEDPGATNYDSKVRIIRSMFNGSRGPLLRPATGLDWAGDPIEVEHRFHLGHGERSYQEMLDHFKDYNDIVGDHPQNLAATTLALNAYMLTGESKYKRWLLEYVDAWRERLIENNYIIPTKIGLDGKIGAADGKWYGGVYGWGFSVEVPQTGKLAHRNTHHLGLVGFLNAYRLTGDDRYLDPWRKQIDAVNAQAKVVNGKTVYPTMYGDDGWYNFVSAKYDDGVQAIYHLTMNAADRKRLPDGGWISFLEGKNPNYPEQAMNRDFARIRQRVQGMRNDDTTPDTRLADDPMPFNPASVTSLVQLMLGGLMPGREASVLQCRLRYFDPQARRAGLPTDVAALVESMTNDSVTVQLVNVNQLDAHDVTIQAGGYGEHQFVTANTAESTLSINDSQLSVQLAPGSGARLTLKMKRFVNQPTLAFPWNRDRTVAP